jgi:hypothetical protein
VAVAEHVADVQRVCTLGTPWMRGAGPEVEVDDEGMVSAWASAAAAAAVA